MRWIFILTGLAYPLLLFAGLTWFDPRHIAVAVACVVLLRLFRARHALSRELAPGFLPVIAALALLIGLGVASNEARYLLAVPVLINAALLGAFGWSLIKTPSIVERMARLQAGDLSTEEMLYCRAVTGVWCAFFVINGGVIAWLALNASRAQWALYTGLISYLLIGALFAAEFVYRHYRFRRYLGAPTDALFKKLFPPHEAG